MVHEDVSRPEVVILDIEHIKNRQLVQSPVYEPGEEPPTRSGWQRWALRIIAALLAGWGLHTSDFEPLGTILILFLIVVPFEKIFPRHKGQKTLRPHLATDLAYAMAAPVLNTVGLIVAGILAVLSLLWVPGLLLRPLVALIPDWAMPIVAFVLFDFIVYWSHRFYHEVPFLWRFHAIHHSTEHLDWISGFRAHPLDGALIAPAFVFLIAAGFSPETSGVIALLQILLGLFFHANVRWKLKPIQKLVQTPEFHHWHHSNHPEALWSNYAGFLPIWDILFGTWYMPGHGPEEYGVDEHIPEGMAEQLLHPFRGLWPNPWEILRHPFRSIGKLFRFLRALLKEMWASARRPRGHTPFRTPPLAEGELNSE